MNSVRVSSLSEQTINHSVASFLLKTFEILEKAQFSHIISWTSEDDTFAIKNILQFTNEILPKYFRHKNFSSFVRQLNMYDFHKIKQTNEYIVFRNPLFRRGQSHLLRKIKRKAPKKNQQEKKVNSTVGINYLEDSTVFKQTIENGIQESTQIFQKSLLSLETTYSLIQKNSISLGITSCQHLQQKSMSELLEKVSAMQKLSNSCFRCVSNMNSFVVESLKQKHLQYSRFLSNLPAIVCKKNVSTGSISESCEIKSQCSIANGKQNF